MNALSKPTNFAGRHIQGGRLTRLAPAASPIATNDRTVSFVLSDESVDRYGDVIKASGWSLDNYRRNPVVLFGHDASSVTSVIGVAKNVRIQGRQLLGEIEFMSADVNQNAESAFQMVKGGYLSAVSVGFAPIEWKAANDKARPGGVDFTKVELLEVSLVPIPANANALVTSRSFGVSANSKDFTMSKHDPAFLERVRQAADAARRHGVSDPSAIGFRSFGEFLQVVARAAVSSSAAEDRRLVRASGLNETDPTMGGFAVPDIWLDEIVASIWSESVLGGLVDFRETDQPLAGVKLPGIDEVSRATGARSGGLISYWDSEAIQPPSSYPKFRNIEFSSKRLVALTYATSELVNDAPLFAASFREAIQSDFSFRTDEAILFGSGVGVPLGVVNSPATIATPKQNGQGPGAILKGNVLDMWSRLPGPLRRRAIWVGNSDIENALVQADQATGISSNFYAPAGSDGDASPRICGRPFYVVESCPPIGTPGDLILIDPRSYLMLTNPMRFAISVHARWISDQVVFRVVWRLDGKPKFSSPIAPANGGALQSPFVTLAAR